MKKRNHYTVEFKTKVVLEILSEAATLNEIAAKYGISPVVLSRWKQEFLERASEVFKKGLLMRKSNLRKRMFTSHSLSAK